MQDKSLGKVPWKSKESKRGQMGRIIAELLRENGVDKTTNVVLN
jgi:hypothetical protein